MAGQIAIYFPLIYRLLHLSNTFIFCVSLLLLLFLSLSGKEDIHAIVILVGTFPETIENLFLKKHFIYVFILKLLKLSLLG